ncbi:MAG: SDR family NAD(P)-dependent oxidoreductase [Crocinitomicaceae bacterium]|nr:SDR family NAD(P)-dependent oxidoreductase [Crocinitomicaceae bacterium]
MSKVVLVTGASSGIGKAVAVHLRSSGYRVFGTGRKVNTGDIINGFEMVRLDVTDEASITLGIDYILSKTGGKLHALVNNAGLGMVGPIENISNEEVNEIFRTNVFGVLNMCRACIPVLRRVGGGHIINITSLAGVIGLPFRGIYSASKFAVEGFTESLSQELHQFNIRVSIVQPGDFRTNINATRYVASFVDESVYGRQSTDILAQVSREVDEAPTPEAVGQMVGHILSLSSPRLRYKVASPLQKISVLIKRISPDRWFEKLVMKRYKLK